MISVRCDSPSFSRRMTRHIDRRHTIANSQRQGGSAIVCLVSVIRVTAGAAADLDAKDAQRAGVVAVQTVPDSDMPIFFCNGTATRTNVGLESCRGQMTSTCQLLHKFHSHAVARALSR